MVERMTRYLILSKLLGCTAEAALEGFTRQMKRLRVVDVARRHGGVAHQLSDWRRQAREGLLRLPLGMLRALSVQKDGLGEPAFVPVAVMPEPEVAARDASICPVSCCGRGVHLDPDGGTGCGIVVRVPGAVAVARAAALVRALHDNP